MRLAARSADSPPPELADASEFLCPLTHELLVDPARAEDDRVYERAAIAEHIREAADEQLTSPVTGQPMGPRLTTAFSVRERIERLVRSGALRGPLAERWLARLREDAAAAEAARIIQSVTGAVATGRLGLWLSSNESPTLGLTGLMA